MKEEQFKYTALITFYLLANISISDELLDKFIEEQLFYKDMPFFSNFAEIVRESSSIKELGGINSLKNRALILFYIYQQAKLLYFRLFTGRITELQNDSNLTEK